ncbi:NADP-dependent oxidoreductase domain-containing protein [Aspergillus bertholletiae]|uniref:NADP-dependent oxidoreductase domain-containing protein n=1 Tax=Aspergillus bertholletiae TaxID=1226010 RepID=A0A5N7BMP7_9EURO|nr:NADP-dependent oxidoreductase domain-containing protein [Aspergillus bertholletiae]
MISQECPQIIFGTAAFGTGSPLAKIQDEETAVPIIAALQARNVTYVDTARAYPVGSPGAAERLLGDLGVPTWASLSTKVSSWAPGAHTAERIQQSVAESLGALKTDKVDIMYLHSPDRITPFEETCRAMDAEYRKGKFARFGISNFTAEEVEELLLVCEKHGFIKPSVYQGRYNPVIRSGEVHLFPLLRRHGISFYAYSPAAVGLFTGRLTQDPSQLVGSRWDGSTVLGKNYRNAYYKPAVIAAAQTVADAGAAAGLSGHELALRWTIYHSALSREHGDAVIIGASSLSQLIQNLDAVEAGPLNGELARLVGDVGDLVRGEAAVYHL